MSLKQAIQEDIKAAMKAGAAEKLSVLRFMWSAVRKKEIDSQKDLDDMGVIEVIVKILKQQQESLEAYTKGQREDLANKTQAEISILKMYLPEQLTEEQITELVERAIKKTGATSIKDIGAVMSFLKPQVAGRADSAKVSLLVKTMLGVS